MADHWDDLLEPIAVRLADGGELVTLRDAGEYINALPKREQDKPEWQYAVRQLLRAAERHRMFACLAINRALHGKPEPPIGFGSKVGPRTRFVPSEPPAKRLISLR
jgi:hypothetical protein